MDFERDPKMAEPLAELMKASDIPAVARAITANQPDTAVKLIEFAIRLAGSTPSDFHQKTNHHADD